ncbi:hypothetical protein DP939_01125 [Spongiactinospora rosea]|uniref:Altered inheritance of mitochondria protein 6 n=1 Tax=Spongiactinospora rosea TaxID=2248750 RepID=A0A366M583_9ACTN|nr:hypothetical protein [Spongiactinospora rosea]RBQ21351.1 hypothetical protein DP939_01125 [Spongiactinospora rosea]
MTARTTLAKVAAFAVTGGIMFALPASATTAEPITKEPPPQLQLCTAFQQPWLPNAHSHNDYNHRRPLCDALFNGHTSVEADIWYVRNIADQESIQVGHSAPSGSTLNELYLNKLRAVIEHNHEKYGSRTVLPRYHGRFQLLIDIKSTGREGARAFEMLHQMLRDRYRTVVTRWHNGRKIPGPVDVVVTGNRPVDPVIDNWRFVGIDGSGQELNGRHRPGRCKRVPLVSSPWTDAYNDPAVLKRMARTASARGQYFRVYHASEDSWQKLYAAGVHYIDSSLHPAALRHFLKGKRPVVAPRPCIP